MTTFAEDDLCKGLCVANSLGRERFSLEQKIDLCSQHSKDNDFLCNKFHMISLQHLLKDTSLSNSWFLGSD